MSRRAPTTPRRPRPPRRGSTYLAVLGISMLVTTMGLGAMLAIRSQRRTAALLTEESDARAYALAALDLGRRAVASDSAWRSKYSNAAYTTPAAFARGTLSYALVDEADGDLNDDALEPMRLFAAGRIGGTTRIYSLSLSPAGPGLAALAIPVYTGGAMTLSGTAYASGGPVACAGLCTVSLGASFNGDVECGTILPLGTVKGTATTGVAPRALPAASLFSTYKARGAPISFASIPAGTIRQKVLSPGSNPFGSASATGIYTVDVPALSNLTITQTRLASTLVVDLGLNASLTITGANLWDPPADGMPILIVRGTALATVTINGSLVPLAESTGGANLNPASTPYYSASDADTGDTYPSELHGLIHITGSSVGTTLTANAVLRGSLISSGAVTLSGGAIVLADPELAKAPPWGYFTPTRMLAQPLTWRRELGP